MELRLQSRTLAAALLRWVQFSQAQALQQAREQGSLAVGTISQLTEELAASRQQEADMKRLVRTMREAAEAQAKQQGKKAVAETHRKIEEKYKKRFEQQAEAHSLLARVRCYHSNPYRS